MLDEVAAEVTLRGESVVRAAAERQIFQRVLAALCKRRQMMKFEPVRLSAALPRAVDIRAAPFIALEDRTPDRGRHISPALPALARYFLFPGGRVRC
ncbi:MAG TPA: hypothetical protein VFQ35_15965 [Polyangiaceae bacterium]|nr:hypothetical protein [Polyangiaceae bacterium]